MLAIYTRLSIEDEASNSINNQIREGKLFAEKMGFDSYEIYNEGEGLSGGLDIENRPQLDKLIKDIINGDVKKVWFRNQNRLERNSLTFHTFAHIVKKAKIEVYFADKISDYNDPNTFLQSSIISSLNQYSKDLQGQQTKKAIELNFKDGKTHGITPYGYAKGENSILVINEEEAQIVKRIYTLSLEGIGTNKIAEIFNNDGILTRYNKIGKGTITTINKHTKQATTKRKKDINWSGNTIRNIITNTLYKGERKFRNEFVKAPIIINPIQWQKVNDNLKKNRNNSGANVEHKYLLKGKLICGTCGRNYYGRTRVNLKDNYYMCSSKRYKHENCGNRSINITILEDLIWQRFFADKQLMIIVEKHFENNDLETVLFDLSNKLSSLNKELETNTNQRKKAIKLAVSGLLAEEDIKPEIKRIDKEKTDIEIKINNIKEQLFSYNNMNLKKDEVDTDLSKLKNDTSFNDKREIINKYIREIEILYKEPFYILRIEFNIPNIESEHYILENVYDIAWDVCDKIIIPISNKSKNYTENELKLKAEKLELNFHNLHSESIILDLENNRLIFE